MSAPARQPAGSAGLIAALARKMPGRGGAWAVAAAGAAAGAVSAVAPPGTLPWPAPENHLAVPLNVAALGAALAAAGHGIAGRGLGCLLDERNRFSLARAQLLAWGVTVFALLLSAVEWNIAVGAAAPLEVTIPTPLLVVLGLSAGTAALAPGLLGLRANQTADATQQMKPEQARVPTPAGAPQDAPQGAPQGAPMDAPRGTQDGGGLVARGQVIGNETAARASWRDLLTGDEVSNAGRIDLGKAQQALLTLVLTVGYLATARSMFHGTGPVTTLPPLGTVAAALLAASHASYLVQKVTPKADANAMTPPPTNRAAMGNDGA